MKKHLTKALLAVTLTALATVGFVACDLFPMPIVTRNPWKSLGKTGYLYGTLVAESYIDTSNKLPYPSEEQRNDTTFVWNSKSPNNKGISFYLRTPLKEVRDDYSRYINRFGDNFYNKKKPSFPHPLVDNRPELSMATVERVTITADRSFGDDYPVGSNLAPLCLFHARSYEEYIANGYTYSEKPGEGDSGRRIIRGDDTEAWRQLHLYPPHFGFELTRKLELKEDEFVTLTITMELINRLASDTERCTLKRIVAVRTLPQDGNKQVALR